MTVKKIKIDRQRCIGCGSCTILMPDVFFLDTAEGKAKVKAEWEKSSPDDLRQARDACPVQAITLEK